MCHLLTMKTFHLVRHKDLSGVSGTGIVAEGVQLSNQKCILHWLSKAEAITVYDSMAELEQIHGHDGATIVVFDERRLA